MANHIQGYNGQGWFHPLRPEKNRKDSEQEDTLRAKYIKLGVVLIAPVIPWPCRGERFSCCSVSPPTFPPCSDIPPQTAEVYLAENTFSVTAQACRR